MEQIVPDPDWYERYGQRIQENRLPSSKEERKTLAEEMGTDGVYLLDLIWSESNPQWLRSMEAVEILRQVWIQQFYLDSGSIQLREPSNCPPAAMGVVKSRWWEKKAIAIPHPFQTVSSSMTIGVSCSKLQL